jgi:hypothetical protein
MDVAELKRELSRAKGGKGRRYPRALREAILDFADRAKRGGKSHSTVAAELGMSAQTLWQWRAARRRAALVPVAIVPAPAASELVVEYGALRVRGLDVASVAELLKRLV